jgi:hypothetical protein
MKSFSNWQAYLARERGAKAAAEFMRGVRERYEVLLKQVPSLLPPIKESVLARVHLRENILPGLALYQSYLEESDQATAFAHTANVLEAEVSSEASRIRLAFYLIPRRWQFPLFRTLLRKQMALEFPEEGWDFTWLEDSPRRVAFDARRCFYLNTLTAYDAPELTPVFCACDEWQARGFSPSIRFERNTTLARGGERCDFCYRSIKV